MLPRYCVQSRFLAREQRTGSSSNPWTTHDEEEKHDVAAAHGRQQLCEVKPKVFMIPSTKASMQIRRRVHLPVGIHHGVRGMPSLPPLAHPLVIEPASQLRQREPRRMTVLVWPTSVRGVRPHPSSSASPGRNTSPVPPTA